MAPPDEPFEEHPLVAAAGAAVNDPGVSGILLTGYLGRGADDATARLYLDSQLSSYLEFPVDAIMLARNPADDADIYERSQVWLKADTIVTLVETTREEIQASFLEGELVDSTMHHTAQALGIVAPATTWKCVKESLQWCGPVTDSVANCTKGACYTLRGCGHTDGCSIGCPQTKFDCTLPKRLCG